MSDDNLNVTNPAFWAERLAEGVKMGLPHWGVVQESREWWATTNAVSAAVLSQVFRFYRPRSVLDAACGIGNLCECVPTGIRYMGVDFCKDLIDVARNRYPNHAFLVEDCRDLPFSNGEFDLVFCRGLEGTAKEGYGVVGWGKMQAELLRVSRIVLVSMSVYEPGCYELINHAGDRLICVHETPSIPHPDVPGAV